MLHKADVMLMEGHLRICRPISLTQEDAGKLVARAQTRIGVQYDLKHVFDLARYMVPLPLPRARALGSADPSRAICSTLVAEAFQAAAARVQEIYHIQDTGLFTPRDFDISPYFHVIKPHMPQPFDHHNLMWVACSEPTWTLPDRSASFPQNASRSYPPAPAPAAYRAPVLVRDNCLL